MTVAAIVRPPRGLALVLGLNRDRLLYTAMIVLALWLGAALGEYLLLG
ncbi:MAG: hypothetical protein H3C51_06115 [Rubellimicrobium sp.]|nr:hypothetical protein [Rubellimicrobium sp.]